MADFRITNHGSVCSVSALSDDAKAFAEENFAVPDFCGTPIHFTTDARPAALLMEQMQEQGFEIEGL